MTAKMQQALPAKTVYKRRNQRWVNSQTLAQKQTNMDGDQIAPSARIRTRKIGWQTSKSAAGVNVTSAKNAKAPSNMPPKPAEGMIKKCQTSIQVRQNLSTMGGRNGKTEH